MTKPTGNGSRLTILVVEDEPSVALLERKALEKHGHKVITAQTGTKALSAIHSGSVDITLLDNQLPDMTGIEVLAEIRNRYHDMPVIMITGNEGAALATEVMKAGASDYVVKDFESKYLFNLPKIVANNWKNYLLVAERRKAEEALIESEQRLKQLSEEQDLLLENAGDFIYRHDLEGVFTYISKSVSNVTGYAVEDWLEHYSKYMTDSAINEGVSRNTEKAIKTGERQPPYIVEIFHKEGRKIILEVDERPVVENGVTIGIIGSARDVTARVNAERRLQKKTDEMAELLKALPDIYFRLDKNGTILEYGAPEDTQLYLAPEKFLGKQIKEILPANVTEKFRTAAKEAKEQHKTITYEYELPLPSGDSIFEARLTSLVGDEFMALIRDVTDRKKAMDALAQSEEKQRLLLEGTDVVAWEYDWLEQRFIYVAGSAIKKYGYDKSEWLKKGFWIEHIAPEEREKTIEYCSSCSKEGENHDFEYRFIHADGHLVWVREIVSVETRDGEPLLLRGFLIDIDDRKKAEESIAKNEAKYRTLFDGTTAAVMLLSDNYFIDCNKATWQMFGCKNKEEFINRHPGEWSPPDQPNGKSSKHGADKKMAEAIKKGGLRFEWIHRRKDGSDFEAEVLLSPLQIDDKNILQAIVTDISTQKRAEKELLKAKEEAEKATKIKDKFVSLVAHDISTPFGSLVSFLQLLENDPDVVLSTQQKSLLRSLLKSGEQQLKMIKELLDISRLQTGSIVLRPQFYDGYSIAVNAIGSISHIAEKKHIKLKNSVPVGSRLYCDPDLYSEVILNLANNAAKFCREGDTIEFLFFDNGDTGLGVRDTGAGVPPEFLPGLLRHDIKTTSPGSMGETGTGLGLPYCNDIMKAHGGRLVVESKPGKGAFFSAALPLVTPVILVVDDDASLLDVIRLLLEEVGATILEATDGKEAMPIITENRPHVIVSDLHMPNMDGFDLLEWVRSDPDLKKTPFIVLTSDSDIELRDQAFRMGADDFLTKPFPKQELIPRVRRFLI